MDGLLLSFGIFFLVLAVIAARIGALPKVKVWLSEGRVDRVLRKSLPPSHYTVMRDVCLPSRAGLIHIDQLVISPFGIFVIETLHKSGWIFGSAQDPLWTLTTSRKKNDFPNPLLLNAARIKMLATLLQQDQSKFHSVVVFTGDAELKNALPVNVTKLGSLLLFVLSRIKPLLEFEEADRLAGIILSHQQEWIDASASTASGSRVKPGMTESSLRT